MTLAEIENSIWEAGSLNREHVFEFLKLQDTTGTELAQITRDWLNKLHSDDRLSKIVFSPEPAGQGLAASHDPIERILNDLDTYGRPTVETLLGGETPAL